VISALRLSVELISKKKYKIIINVVLTNNWHYRACVVQQEDKMTNVAAKNSPQRIIIGELCDLCIAIYPCIRDHFFTCPIVNRRRVILPVACYNDVHCRSVGGIGFDGHLLSPDGKHADDHDRDRD